jgi:hypothetical protein
VRELYRRPNPDPGQVVERIVLALDPSTRTEMAGPGVATCLGALVSASHGVNRTGLPPVLLDLGVGAEPAALQLAAGLRRRAQDQVVAAGAASRFSELALDALAVATMDAASGGQTAELLTLPAAVAERHFGGYAADGRLHDLAGTFVAYDLDRVFRYYVSRDLSDFVGSDAFPHVGAAHRFLDSVALHCRRTAAGLPLADSEPFLQGAAAAAAARSPGMLDFTTRAIDLGLGVLGEGGDAA